MIIACDQTPRFICRRRYEPEGFTLVELLATIAIVAMLTAVAVVYIGNYITAAKKTSDQRTLLVLNDALTRYKTEGGSLIALTQGAPVGHLLAKMASTISWGGLTHQVLRAGQTYPARSLSGLGDGKQYRFIKYGTYTDTGVDTAAVMASAISGALSAQGSSVGDGASFNACLANAIAQTGSVNYLALTNPSSTDRIGMYLDVTSAGKKVRVWWGDGTTSDYDAISAGSGTVLAKVYGSSAVRSVVVVGDVGRLESYGDAGIGGATASNFSGDISTMPTLTRINLRGSGAITGDIGRFSGLTFINLSVPNTLRGTITNLTGLTDVILTGNAAISGDVTALTGLKTLYVGGSCALTGNISNLTNFTILSAGGVCNFTGSVTNLNKLILLSLPTSPSLTGHIGLMTQLQYVYVSSPVLDYSSVDWNNLTAISSISVKGLTQAQVDSLLLGMWNNRDAAKPNAGWFGTARNIVCTSACAAPSAAGVINKNNLKAYKTPNDTGPMVWSVTTN